MRQEYTRLASAELQLDIPWIIDNMDNTLQKTYGGMPNMEFVIDKDGTLLASWDWAKPEELKKVLEERLGPSGISEEKWAELANQPRMAVSFANNDEVPATEVPRQALSPLKIKNVTGEDAPVLLEVGTLPPKVTPSGLSRMYLTITPDEKSKAFFDNAVATEILLENAQGIQLQKEKIVAGKRRSGQDIYPHTVGVMWAQNEGTENLEFTATIKANMGQGEDEASQEWTRTFHVYGSIPTLEKSMDEILPDKLPAKEKLDALDCTQTSEESVPYTVEASLYRSVSRSTLSSSLALSSQIKGNFFKSTCRDRLLSFISSKRPVLENRKRIAMSLRIFSSGLSVFSNSSNARRAARRMISPSES